MISSICFTLMAVMIKQVRHLPLMEIMLFRNIPTMIIIPIILIKTNISLLGNNKPILWLRGIMGTIGMLAMFYTFTVILLTDAMAIQQLRPFFVFFLSGIFLKEKLSLHQLPFFIFAFLGALLVIKPGLRIDMFPIIIALLAAVSTATVHVTLRYLRLTDHHLVIINYFAYISGIISLIMLFLQKTYKVPSLFDLFILILIGGIAFLAQIALTKAYQLSPASLVSLYTYSQIIFASIFDLIFFKEIPDIFSIIGASCIIISGYLNYRYKSNN